MAATAGPVQRHAAQPLLPQDAAQQTANSIRLAHLLETHDCAAMKVLFHAFFASIPYHWYTNNHIGDYDGFYASVFYSCFGALGYYITVEESTSLAQHVLRMCPIQT